MVNIIILKLCNTTNSNYHAIEQLYHLKRSVGQAINRKLMRDLRIYMAVGGMRKLLKHTLMEKILRL